jgi:hypothetical protein
MATIDDLGGTTDPLNAPALGGPTGWAAAVRDAIHAVEATALANSNDIAANSNDIAANSNDIAANSNDIAQRWIIWTGSQAAYDGLGSYDPDTLYVVTS